MFLFKKEKIVLTAYTDDPTLLEMFPVVESNKNYPPYYKTLESKFQKLDKRNSPFVDNAPEKQSTIRSCYGINNFNNYGFIVSFLMESVLIAIPFSLLFVISVFCFALISIGFLGKSWE